MEQTRKPNVVNEERPEVLQRVELVALLRQVLLVDGAHDVQPALLQHVAEVDEREGVWRGRVEKNGGTPVLGMVLIEVELQEHFADLMEDERLRDVAPLLPRRRVEQVDEDGDHHDHRDEGFASGEAERRAVHPVDVEHDDEVQQGAGERDLPGTKLEARSVVRRAGDAKNERGEIDESVRQTEEIGHNGRDGLLETPLHAAPPVLQ